jgi:hypothetical protein
MARQLKRGETRNKRSTEGPPTPQVVWKRGLTREANRREKCLPQAMASQAGEGISGQQYGGSLESRVWLLWAEHWKSWTKDRWTWIKFSLASFCSPHSPVLTKLHSDVILLLLEDLR